MGQWRPTMALACVLAAAGPSWAASQVGTTTSADAFAVANRFYTHHANGHYWVAYYDGTQPVLASSPDAATWTSQGAMVVNADPDYGGWFTRYSGDHVIVLASTSSSTIYYRHGRLNADGTVTWDGADADTGVGFQSMNGVFANQEPVIWKATAGAGSGSAQAGRLYRGSPLVGPIWTASATSAAALTAGLPTSGTGGEFFAGAPFPTGGADPRDLLVLRASTLTSLTAEAHRLIAIRWNAVSDAYDAAWYNVSTLGGTLAEDATTQVKPVGWLDSQKRFAAVRDTSGNIHAVYVNASNDVVHYRKAVGFDGPWSRISTDVTQSASTIDKVALSAAGGNNLYLFYSKSDSLLYYRRFDGATWGPEGTIPKSAAALQGALASMEMADGCGVGLAWVEGSASPYKVMFSLATGSCSGLSTIEGSGRITVTAPGSFELVFDSATGGGIHEFYDLAEDPARTYDLAGNDASGVKNLQHFGLLSSGVWYDAGSNTGPTSPPRLDLLEATSTRVRVRQESFLQQGGTSNILAGVKAFGDHTVHPAGRTVLRWDRRSDGSVPVTDQDAAIGVREEEFCPPHPSGLCGNLSPYQDSGDLPPAPGPPWGDPGTDFFLARRDAPGVRTDFLHIQHQDWALADRSEYVAIISFLTWRDLSGGSIGTSDVWNLLTYFKPTHLGAGASPWLDPEVAGRSADYRNPAAPGIMVGTSWQDPDEHTASDNFNEAEAAYLFTLDPTNGLRVDLDGATTPRFRPFFKIRQWRSPTPPWTITLDPDSGGPAPVVTLTRGIDYRADVKPVSRAHFAQDLLWHSTLESQAALDTAPDVGSPGSISGAVTFVPARYGSGAQIADTTSYFNFPTAGHLDPARGAIEFWYKPTYASDDGSSHTLGGYNFNGANYWLLEKDNANVLRFKINNLANGSEIVAPAGSYSWRAGDWVHLRFEWDDSLPVATQLKIFVNGVEPNPGGGTGADYVAATNVSVNFQVGRHSPSGGSPGVYDEVHVYGGSATTPSPLARGGLTASPVEYLASPTNNFPLTFGAVNGTRQGEYLHLGSDSKYRGLNVLLATPGASAGSPDLQWQYWNGTSWASLTLTDQTAGFTGDGTIYWTDDPFGWSPYSVNGGPDLYYVRAYMKDTSPPYTTDPVEGIVTTDVLLFQYCVDVTTDDEEFTFGAPVPTAVELLSFEAFPSDSAADLVWRTASELDNLGFHLHRSLSGSGPWARITPSLIPGLGSSPIGATYSWHDTGVSNGTRYFYRLEDVDLSSVSTFHGPVSAVPQTAEPPGEGGGDEEGEDGEDAGGVSSGADSSGGSDTGGSAGDGSGDEGPVSTEPVASTSCAPSSGPFPCVEVHGDPSLVSVEVLSRRSGHVEVELVTGGFEAVHEADGRVWVSVPGFEDPGDPHAPALPFRRVMLDGEVGKAARVAWLKAWEEETYPGLVPSAVGYREMEVRSDGTVRAARREASRRDAARGYLPPDLVRLGEETFVGETKRVSLELFPVRFDGSRGAVTLLKRLRVGVEFSGSEAKESGSGSRGRRAPRRRPGGGDTLAFLHTTHRGLHAIGFEELFTGRTRALPLDVLGLHRQGVAVPFHVEPGTSSFGPGSVLYFYAERGPESTSFGPEVAYELVRAAGGTQMAQVSASPHGESVTRAPLGPVSEETNRIYQSGLLEAEDVWLWEALVGGSGGTKRKSFVLEGVDGGSSEAGRVSVWLQGASDVAGVVDHHVRVWAGPVGSAVLVGEASFDGKRPYRFSASVPSGVWREGENELVLENVGDTGVYSLVFLDRFEVAYPQMSALRGGVFEGEWSEEGIAQITLPGGAAESTLRPVTASASGGSFVARPDRAPREDGIRSLVDGLGSVAAVDVTNPASPSWLVGLEPGPGTARLRVETGRRYVLVSPEALRTPRVSSPPRSSLTSVTNLAEYIVIAPEAFLPAARTLAERRAGQGLWTKAVSLEEIASVFGHGEASGEAIRSFLTYAYHSWQRPSPRYVVLLGDASFDPRNFTGSSAPAPLPALFLETSYLVTASDPALGAVNGEDLLPDLSIGRLPAQTAEEAEALVEKLAAWEDSGQGLRGRAVLVADDPDGAGDFEADVADIATSFLSGRETRRILLSQEGAGTRGRILDAFNEGASLVSYVGHGGAAVWASENVWNSWDTESLSAQSEQPLMLTMNCLNGYFVAPGFDSLGEAYLMAVGRGTIAAFSPSGLSLDVPAHQLHRALMRELTRGDHERLGDAVLAAQQAYAETGLMPELLSIYHLLGDPATTINR